MEKEKAEEDEEDEENEATTTATMMMTTTTTTLATTTNADVQAQGSERKATLPLTLTVSEVPAKNSNQCSGSFTCLSHERLQQARRISIGRSSLSEGSCLVVVKTEVIHHVCDAVMSANARLIVTACRRHSGHLASRGIRIWTATLEQSGKCLKTSPCELVDDA